MWLVNSGYDRAYYDAGDGREKIFVIMPDGSVAIDDGEELHRYVAQKHSDRFKEQDYRMDGWCRGYVCHDEQLIEFYPFDYQDIYEYCEGAFSRHRNGGSQPNSSYMSELSTWTESTAKAVYKLIEMYAGDGYEVWIEFENHEEGYTHYSIGYAENEHGQLQMTIAERN